MLPTFFYGYYILKPILFVDNDVVAALRQM